MTLWADGDSLPAELRLLIERRAATEAAKARASGVGPAFRLVFVASRKMIISPPAELILVEAGSDAADDRIVDLAEAGDLAITRDLPLAERLVKKGLVVLNDRGNTFTAMTIGERRSLRDGAEALRALGLAPESRRGKTYGPRELRDFANAFDRELGRALRSTEKQGYREGGIETGGDDSDRGGEGKGGDSES